jgi:transposase-like protein
VPPPLDPQLRADILRDIQDGQLSRNEIARRRNVSPSTVSKIAKDEGQSAAFDRTQTAKATRAKQIDNAARRTVLIDRMYDVASHMLDRVTSPYTQVVSGPAGAEFVTTKLPPLRDAQAGMSSAAIAIDKAARMEAANGDSRVEQARTLLGGLMSDLVAAHGDSYPSDGAG